MHKKNPLVSVIVPTHNRPYFLEKTLKSIISQTYLNTEIFIISNGINDKNKLIIEKMDDPRLIYFEQENSGGPSSPRNHGIRRSKGKYIAFCDDDDIWIPEKLLKQVKILEENPQYGICYTKMLRFDEKSEWVLLNEEGQATLDSLLYVNTIPISSVLIRKSLVDKYGGFSESKIIGTSEDYEFLLRYATATRFYFLNEYLIKYWSGENRTTLVDDKRKIKSSLRYLFGVVSCYFLVKRSTTLSAFKLIKPIVFHVNGFLRGVGYIIFKKLHLK